MSGGAPRVGIVGGGVLGSVMALRLAQAGVDVTLLERAPALGGLAGAMDLGGHRIDRFYHVIVPSDERMIALAGELGLDDRLSFAPVGAGFYADGRLHDFNGVGDLLRFSPLSPVARARLAAFVVRCQLRASYDDLEATPLEHWLRRTCGDEVTDRIWRPLLDSRFDGEWGALPATYLWARTNRMRSARGAKGGTETMGCLAGGHETLITAAADEAVRLGADVRVGAGVERLALDADGRVEGVVVDGSTEAFDLTVATLQPPGLRHLLPESLHGLLAPYPQRFLGVVCLVMTVRRRLLPYYAVNICDPTPITTVVEAADVVGTAHTGGLRVVYVPRYCEAGSETFGLSDEEVFARFTTMVAQMAPDFDRRDVVDWTVQRAPVVEPVHEAGTGSRIAPVWPEVEGLALASASQVYPRLLNGESVLRLAEDVAGQVVERVGRGPAGGARELQESVA